MPLHARIALVIGNSNYAQGPLENPENDARAVAHALRDAGFEVELLIDQKRVAMRTSIERFGTKLTAKKQPSVFYYAGHAMQLDWRNYLLPTDINIRTAEDVHSQAIDLNELLQQLTKASSATGGSSNIVILDACRDNPFGKTANAAKGLSQIDAPTGTLLAYATAPGNVAQDAGTGSNGLYTENLLREMKVDGAKIEDVLKRVRLSVRLQSKGQQVPWESTSLEEDFYFKPPVIIQKPTREAAAKAFEEELAAWERVKSTETLYDLEQFIRIFPSGKFSELAQYRLDIALAAQKTSDVSKTTTALTLPKVIQDPSPNTTTPATAPSIAELLAAAAKIYNPNNQPEDTVAPATPGEIRRQWRVGDLMVFKETPQTGFFKYARELRYRVMSANKYVMTTRTVDRFDSFFNQTRSMDFVNNQDAQTLSQDYSLGKSWSTRFNRTYGRWGQMTVDGSSKVVAKETLDLPAGKFNVFKVLARGTITNSSQFFRYEEIYWIDTVSQKPIAWDKKMFDASNRLDEHKLAELIAFENDGRPDRD
jgi:uncharacterized caspase-like protein